MATVRTTTPRTDGGGKRKRKRVGKSKTASLSSPSSIEAQLTTLENWQRSLTVDMRELRRECFRVRREVDKVDDVAEAAVEASERCALQASAAQQSATAACKAKDEALEEAKKKVHTLETRATTDMAKVMKKFTLWDKKLDRQKQDNEDTLMTQLTAFQEQYENELVKMKEDHAADLRAKQKQMASMERNLHKVMEENQRLVQKITQMPTRQELNRLQEEIRTMERDNQEEQARTRADLNTFEDRLVDIDRKMGDLEVRPPMPPPMPPPPLPEPPRDLVRQGDLLPIHDELRRVNRDLHRMGVDIPALAKRIDARSAQQDQKLEANMQELNRQLFEALNHDSRLHASEISRLKDASFDLQSDIREFGQRMCRLENDTPHGRTSRDQPWSSRDRREESRWHRGPDSHAPPLPQHNSFDRPSRYDETPSSRGNAPPPVDPPPEDRIQWESRRRSRSRSPPRRTRWSGASNEQTRADAVSNRNGHRRQHEGRRHMPERSPDGSTSPRSQGTDPTPAQGPPEATMDNERDGTQFEQQTVPFRRNRQSRRRTPEVIVIEEDDDEEEDDEEEREEGSMAPNRAPPDVVLDEEDISQADDVIMEPPPDNTNAADRTELTDLLERETDLQTGFLLYFCLGGAPDLDAQWTRYFSQLRTDECVEMPRALRFQRRYIFLQNFPVYLTQCILQAVIINRQTVSEENEAFQAIGVLDVAAVRNRFYDVVEGIHLSWAKALVQQLSEDLASHEPLASEMKLSINPAGLSAAGDNDELICEWRRLQAPALWTLARELHYGSLMPSVNSCEGVSPAVYLFALMFDVLTVSSECPQSGSYRLNAFGGKMMSQLWNQTLKKLPYVFFADWSWLDDQSAKEKLPALGFCHLLASILLWNSAMDRYSLMNRILYADAVSQMLSKLYVDRKPIRDSSDADASSLLVSKCESTHIDLLDIDAKFTAALGLDGFFEVWEAIQSNMLAVGMSAPPS